MNIQESPKPAEAPADPPAKKPVLKLTKAQETAATLWDSRNMQEVAAAAGVSLKTVENWKEQPLFLAEIAETRLGIDPDTPQKQAAALAFGGVSYADAEGIIKLKEGTIMKWAQDRKSKFNLLNSEMKRLVYVPPERDDSSDDLSVEQTQAITLIMEGKNDTEVAEVIGKTRETVNRWRHHNDEFIVALDHARETYLDSQIAAVSTGAQKAIAVLDSLLDSEDEKIRFQAASLLLKSAPSQTKLNRKHNLR